MEQLQGNTALPEVKQIVTFHDVTIYRARKFGVWRTDCRTLEMITTGDIVQFQYIQKGKRTKVDLLIDEPHWMVVVKTPDAIDPDSSTVEENGIEVSRYQAYDPKRILDFKTKLMKAGVRPVFVVGA